MSNLTKHELKIIDKILHELHNSGNSELNIPYSILSNRVIEIKNENTKRIIDNILISNDLVVLKGTLKDIYELSNKGRGIISFSKYLKTIKNEKIRNIILLVLGILIPLVALFFQIYDRNNPDSTPQNKNGDSMQKKSIPKPILNKIEKIDTSNYLQIHTQSQIQNTSKTIKSDSLKKK